MKKVKKRPLFKLINKSVQEYERKWREKAKRLHGRNRTKALRKMRTARDLLATRS